MKTLRLENKSQPGTIVNVRYCDTFLSKFIGLMFSKGLQANHGLILVEDKESRTNTSIHMMFMNYDITVLWLDKDLAVVDKVLAKKWKPFYLPKAPAQYVIELHESRFSEFTIGDQLIFRSM